MILEKFVFHLVYYNRLRRMTQPLSFLTLQATGVSSVKTLFSPSENVADIIPLSLSSIVESGSSVVASFFATYDSTPNEIQISLKSSSA